MRQTHLQRPSSGTLSHPVALIRPAVSAPQPAEALQRYATLAQTQHVLTRKQLHSMYVARWSIMHMEHIAVTLRREMDASNAKLERRVDVFLQKQLGGCRAWKEDQLRSQLLLECCSSVCISRKRHIDRVFRCAFTGRKDNTMQVQFTAEDGHSGPLYVVHRGMLPLLDAVTMLCNMQRYMDRAALLSTASNATCTEGNHEFVQVRRAIVAAIHIVMQFSKRFADPPPRPPPPQSSAVSHRPVHN